MTLQLTNSTTRTSASQADESAQQANEYSTDDPWCPEEWYQILSQITDHNNISSALLAALNEQKDESKQGDAA